MHFAKNMIKSYWLFKRILLYIRKALGAGTESISIWVGRELNIVISWDDRERLTTSLAMKGCRKE